MALTRSQKAQQQLNGINKAHRASLAALHADFNKVYDAAMRAHGLTISGLADHLSFPVEFHEDIAEAKRALLAGRALAEQARRSSISSYHPQRRKSA